jgi:predicted permease
VSLPSRRIEERLAEWMLRRVAPSAEADWIIDDLREAFDDARAASGDELARRWYRREVLSSILPLVRRRRSSSRTPSTSNPSNMWQHLISDVAYALRLARRSPLGSMAIILTMVFGIGATTAVFSVVNAVLLQSLPFPDADRVVRLSVTVRESSGGPLAYPDLLDYRRDVSAFSDVTGVATSSPTFQGGAGPEELRAIRSDEAYPRVFGLRIETGRYFTTDEMQVDAARVVILTNGFWRRAFGGDRAVVGRRIILDNEPHQIVGVLPPEAFLYPASSADVLIPLRVRSGTMFVNRGAMWIEAIAKMRPTVTSAAAASQVDVVARTLQALYPNSNTDVGVRVTALRDEIVGPVRPMLRLLALAMAAVLLAASLNIANLLLGRAQSRMREFAVRAALGGSAARIRRQVFSEGLLLAVVGGILGVALAPPLTNALIALYPNGLPRAGEVGLDVSVLIVAAATTLLAGVLAVWPLARRIGRIELSGALREGGRSGQSRAGRRAGRVLIVAQVATSATLLFAAGLLVTTFHKLSHVDPGFDPAGVTTFRLAPSSARHRDWPAVERFYTAVAEGIGRIPGVQAVASASQIPMGTASFGDVFVRPDKGDQGTANPRAYVIAAGPQFDRALGMTIVRGRSFTNADDSTAARVVVIDERLAERAWPGEDPLGRTIDWNREIWRVVGIVRSTRDRELWATPSPHLYAPTSQRFSRARYMAIRTSGAPSGLLASVRAVVRAVDPSVAITDVATLDDRMSGALAEQRFRAWLVGALGALALGLAILGIYGVVSYAVGQRTREIGIRIALGDTAAGVRYRVVAEVFTVAAVGAVVGAAMSLAAGRWIASFLFEVDAQDFGLLAASVASLLFVTIAAAYGPARRASRVDPLVALRSE